MLAGRPSIQYASQLFLSSKQFSPTFIKPTAPILVLAGNNFSLALDQRYTTAAWLQHFSKSWENTIIVPGSLEYTGVNHTVYEMDVLHREFLKSYPNIHYLSCKTVDLPQIMISGAKLWGGRITCNSDSVSHAIHQPYKCNTENLLWKWEEGEWLKDAIQQRAYYKKPHIVVTYSVPHPGILSAADQLRGESLSYYSEFEPLVGHSQPVAGWIFGAPRYTKTSLCHWGKTFMGSNAADGGGFHSGMVMVL